MKERFIVKANDINLIKKFAIYFSIFIIFLIFSWSIALRLMLKKIEEINQKRQETLLEYKLLKAENESLSKLILEKNSEIENIETKLSELEKFLGIENLSEKTYTERLDLAKLTTKEKTLILNELPSGNVLENYSGISSPFGYRFHPILKVKKFHSGIDLRSEIGEKVISSANGIVEYSAYNRNGYGNTVIISHNYGFKTVYAHLSTLDVKTGDFVRKGQVIAKSGNSGRTTGPHLHYEVIYLGRRLNPYYFIFWDLKDYDKIFKNESAVKWESLIEMVQHHYLLKQDLQNL